MAKKNPPKFWHFGFFVSGAKLSGHFSKSSVAKTKPLKSSAAKKLSKSAQKESRVQRKTKSPFLDSSHYRDSLPSNRNGCPPTCSVAVVVFGKLCSSHCIPCAVSGNPPPENKICEGNVANPLKRKCGGWRMKEKRQKPRKEHYGHYKNPQKYQKN